MKSVKTTNLVCQCADSSENLYNNKCFTLSFILSTESFSGYAYYKNYYGVRKHSTRNMTTASCSTKYQRHFISKLWTIQLCSPWKFQSATKNKLRLLDRMSRESANWPFRICTSMEAASPADVRQLYSPASVTRLLSITSILISTCCVIFLLTTIPALELDSIIVPRRYQLTSPGAWRWPVALQMSRIELPSSTYVVPATCTTAQ